MTVEVDYLPVATAETAYVDSQTNFVNAGYQQNGFTNGQAYPFQANKVWRQASMFASAMAWFISNQLGNINVLDDGNRPALTSLIIEAVQATALAAGTSLIAVASSATPVFPATGSGLNIFDITLTANVTSSTLTGAEPGQTLIFIIRQSGSGGFTFAWPSGVPGGVVDGSAAAVNVQEFFLDSAGRVYMRGPIAVNGVS